MQAKGLEDLAREKITTLVNKHYPPRILIGTVFGLLVLLEFYIFIQSQHVGMDLTFCQCKSPPIGQGRILNGIAVPKDELRWVASIYTVRTDHKKTGTAPFRIF